MNYLSRPSKSQFRVGTMGGGYFLRNCLFHFKYFKRIFYLIIQVYRNDLDQISG